MDLLELIATGVRDEVMQYLPEGISVSMSYWPSSGHLANHWTINLYYPNKQGELRSKGGILVSDGYFYLYLKSQSCTIEMAAPDVLDYIATWFKRQWYEQERKREWKREG